MEWADKTKAALRKIRACRLTFGAHVSVLAGTSVARSQTGLSTLPRRHSCRRKTAPPEKPAPALCNSIAAITPLASKRTTLPRARISTFRCANSGVTPSLRVAAGEVFLQDLQGDHRRSSSKMVRKKLGGAFPLFRRGGIVGVDQHVRIEEGQIAPHRSCSSSRSNFHPRELPLAARESFTNSSASAFGSVLPASWRRYSRTSWFTLVPIAAARCRASCITSSSTDNVTFTYTYYVRMDTVSRPPAHGHRVAADTLTASAGCPVAGPPGCSLPVLRRDMAFE
jgi:hypothetical protein